MSLEKSIPVRIDLTTLRGEILLVSWDYQLIRKAWLISNSALVFEIVEVTFYSDQILHACEVKKGKGKKHHLDSWLTSSTMVIGQMANFWGGVVMSGSYEQKTPAMRGRSEVAGGNTVVSFLVAYRGFALVVAVALLFSTGYFRILSPIGWTLVGTAGAFTLFKLLRPLNRYQKNYLMYGIFGFDFALCLSLIIFTGGLNSAFLLYSLSPLLKAAFFFPKKFTFSIAGIPFLTAVAYHQFISGTPISASFNPPELAYSLLLIYLVGSFLLAWLPYMMNINESQNIRAQAIIEERIRLSRDMHDGLAQALSIINWKAQLLAKTVAAGNKIKSLDEISEITEMLEATQHEAKAVIDQLRTNVKSGQGFVPTLAQYATDFARQYGTRCELRVSDGMIKLSSLAETELLYVAQEALNNVRKHAAANVIHLSLESKSDGTEMIISDDGNGFDPNFNNQRGYGLTVMGERVRSIGGELSINSNPGQGTRINVKLPKATVTHGVDI